MPRGQLTYRRGEIWWVRLDPAVGSEPAKTRPCAILQNDRGNQEGSTTIVAPFFPGFKPYPFVVNVPPTKSNQLDRDRHLNLSNLRVVDAVQIVNRLGVLELKYWPDIQKAVMIQLGFSSVFE
ncbi:MAG: type II toxin-antitoxin system PemK/MazF family toxin [Cyanobacteria bacterium J06642_2]